MSGLGGVALSRYMDGRMDKVIPIYPQTLFAGGIIKNTLDSASVDDNVCKCSCLSLDSIKSRMVCICVWFLRVKPHYTLYVSWLIHDQSIIYMGHFQKMLLFLSTYAKKIF